MIHHPEDPEKLFSFFGRICRRNARRKDERLRDAKSFVLLLIAVTVVVMLTIYILGIEALIAPLVIGLVMSGLATAWILEGKRYYAAHLAHSHYAIIAHLRQLAAAQQLVDVTYDKSEREAFDVALKAFGEIIGLSPDADRLCGFIDSFAEALAQHDDLSPDDEIIYSRALRIIDVLGHAVDSAQDLYDAEREMRATHRKLGILSSSS